MEQEDKSLRKKIFEIIEAADEKSKLWRWSKYYDIFMTAVIFLSILPLFTKDHPFVKYVEWGATLIFVIDYVLRWCTADYKLEKDTWLSLKIKIKWVRFVVYPITGWAIIDMLSILPGFYLLNESFRVMRFTRFVRLVRLLKVFRYFKDFNPYTCFWNGIKESGHDMLYSLIVLVTLTVFLALLLYSVEYSSQPEVYSDPFASFIWSFMSYLGNPGKFSPGDPITFAGRCLWVIIAIVKIALFAVPAGLIANGFREAMAKDKKAKKAKKNADQIKKYFYVDCEERNNVNFWRARFERISNLQSKLRISENEIIAAVERDNELRIVNFANSFPEDAGGDPIAVELFHANTNYGYCSNPSRDDDPGIDSEKANDSKVKRNLKSSVLVITPNAARNAGIGFCGYYMSKMGRFNYVSNEYLQFDAPDEENRCKGSTIYKDQLQNYKKLKHYAYDIRNNADLQDWAVILEKTKDDTMITCSISGSKKNGKIIPDISGADLDTLNNFYNELVECEKALNITVARKGWLSKDTYITKWLKNEGICKNVIQISLNRKFLYDKKKSEALEVLARLINRHFETINKYGLSFVPNAKLPVYKGREENVVRLVKEVDSGNYYTLEFEPVDNFDAKKFALGFVLDNNDNFYKFESESFESELKPSDPPVVDVNKNNKTFKEREHNHYIAYMSPKQDTYNYDHTAFSTEGRLRTLLKNGHYKCIVCRYNCNVTLSYEFTKYKNKLKEKEENVSSDKQLSVSTKIFDSLMNSIKNLYSSEEIKEKKDYVNKFDEDKLFINKEIFDFLNIQDLYHKEVMHADEILYDDQMVDGQVFISNRGCREIISECVVDNEGNISECDENVNTADGHALDDWTGCFKLK